MRNTEQSSSYQASAKQGALVRLDNFIEPWERAADTDLVNSLTFTMEELSARMDVTIGQARKLLRNNPPTVLIEDQQYVLQELTELPTPPRTISYAEGIRMARTYRLNPKRILYDSRYESRSPGGGPVQKASIQREKIPGQIRRRSSEKQRWGFIPIENSDVIIREQRYPELRAYLRRIAGKNWIIGNNESIFCDAIERCQQNRGDKLEILLWNCLPFTFSLNEAEAYPTAQILPSLDSANTKYFQSRIAEITAILSSYGQARLTILVPTNEAFGDEAGIWNFSQTASDRDTIINRIVDTYRAQIMPLFQQIAIPVRILRWDEYLNEQGVADQNEFSRQGYKVLNNTGAAITKNAGKNAQLYFDQYGITLPVTPDVIDRQIKYLGMYVGEGLAYQTIANKGANLLTLNLEEGRVAAMNYIGSDKMVPIIQGANPLEIQAYYSWKKRKVRNALF